MKRKPLIEFGIAKPLFGTLPEIKPAINFIPDEYRNTPQRISSENGVNNLTLRTCMPYFDAMTAGFIIPVPVDIRIISDESGVRYFYPQNGIAANGQNVDQPMWVSHHPPGQHEPAITNKVALKFISPYYMKTKKGWGVLFLPPLNRNLPFRPVSGLVNTSKYHSRVNIVATWEGEHGDYDLKQGTPLAQIIPVKLGKDNYNSIELTAEEVAKRDKHGNACTLTRNKYKSDYRERKLWTLKN